MKLKIKLARRLSLLSAILLICLIVPSFTSYAETISEANDKIARESKAYEEKQKELDSKKEDADALISEIQSLDTEISSTNSDISSINTEIEKNTEEINTVEDKISKKTKEIDNLVKVEIPKTESRAAASLKFSQRNENSNFLLNTIMKDSKTSDKQDLIDEARFASILTNESSSSIKSLTDLLGVVQTKKNELSNTKDELNNTKDKLKQKENTLRLQVEKLNSQKDYQTKVKNEINAKMAAIEGDMSNSADIIAAEKEQKRLFKEAGCGPNDVYGVDCGQSKIQDAGGGSGGGGNGAWRRPLAHGTITNEYGPNSNYWGGVHTGIDLANSQGTPVYGASSGVVLFAGWSNDGGGYNVQVLHLVGGRNYVTRYCHMSSINVSQGQSIGKNAQIGAVGNTGNSFGAHLHFEMNQGSSYNWSGTENPRNYISFPALGGSW